MSEINKKLFKIFTMSFIVFALTTAVFMVKVEAKTKVRTPAKPTLKKAVLNSPTTVNIRWKKAKYAKKYIVYYSKNKGKFKKLATTKNTIYIHKTRQLGSTFKYKIKAVNGKKTSKYSNVKSVKTKTWAYMLDLVSPYEKPYWYKPFQGPTFSMGGDSYTNGFTCMGYGEEGIGNVTYFNLHGDYSRISFVAGVVDPEINKAECTVILYADGSPIKTIKLNPDNLPKNYTVNIKNCSQLKISVYDGRWVAMYGGTYGFGGIRLYK